MRQTKSHYFKNLSGRQIYAIAAVVFVGAGIAIAQATSIPYGIYVNDKHIATVKSYASAEWALRQAKSHATPGSSSKFSQSVRLKKASRGCDLTDTAQATKLLQQATSVEAHAYAIVANGEPVVALQSKADAELALSMVKKHYEEMVKHGKPESSFKERVTVDNMYVSSQLLQASADDAAKYLTSTTEPALIHTVKRGDRASKLAFEYKISLNQLKRLNADKNLNRLSDGDSITIQPSKLPITVITRALEEKTVSVTPPRDMRRYARMGNGSRQMRVEVVYENGKQVEEQVLSQITTWNRPRMRGWYGDDEDEDGGYRHYRHHRHYRHYRHSRRHSSESETSTSKPQSSAETSAPSE